MRRVLALIAAIVLVVVVTSPAVGSGPTLRVNRFVGDFDMVDWDMTTVIGHVHAKFTETTDRKGAPGTLDVYWASDNPIRESRAELEGTAFGQDSYPEVGLATEAYAQGNICDYYRAGGSTCRAFAVMFQEVDVEGSSRRVGWGTPGFVGESDWYPAGKGAFALVYAGPTVIVPTNTAPTAAPVSRTTAPDTAVDVTLIGNDPETCELTFAIVSGPTHGSLGSTSDIACTGGSPNYDYAMVTYTPAPGYTGSDEFAYTVSDGTATSLQASAYVTIRVPSPAP